MPSKLKSLTTSQAKRNEAGYNLWASFYDSYPNPTTAIDEISFPKYYAGLRGKNVLEVGCGTGRHTARLIAAGNRVIGIDISEKMLAQAKKKIKDPKLTLIKGDFLREQIKPSSFDAVIACLVLEHIADLSQFFEKVRSVLKAGGCFYFSEIHPERSAAGILAHFKNTDGAEIQLASSAHTESEISGAAQRAGFLIKSLSSVYGSAELTKMNPQWKKYLRMPMIQIWVVEAAE